MIIDNADNIGPIEFTCEGCKYKLFNSWDEYYEINDLVRMNELAELLTLDNVVCWSTKEVQRWLPSVNKKFISDYLDEVVPVIMDGNFYDFKEYVYKLSKVKKDYYADDEDDVPYWAR